MGEMADQLIQDGLDAIELGEDEWEGACEYCGEPGVIRTIDGTPFNCGMTQRVMCDACCAEEFV